jgi:hypothetical protein
MCHIFDTGGEGDLDWDIAGPSVELAPLPYVMAPCARRAYDVRGERTLLEAEDGTDPALNAELFKIPLVSHNNPVVPFTFTQ